MTRHGQQARTKREGERSAGWPYTQGKTGALSCDKQYGWSSCSRAATVVNKTVWPRWPETEPVTGTTNDGSGGTTSPAEAKIIVGGPRTRHGWRGNAGSINTDACFNTCVSQGSSRMVSSRPVLGRVIKRADTGGLTQQPLITVGDVTIIERLVKP